MHTAQAVLTRNRRGNNLSRMAEIKPFFLPVGKDEWNLQGLFFWKQDGGNEKNLFIYLLSMAFLRLREHCLGGAMGGRECVLKCFCRSQTSKMLRSCSHASADLLSNVKLLINVPAELSATMGHTYTSWGNQPPWGGARPESPPSRSQAALML